MIFGTVLVFQFVASFFEDGGVGESKKKTSTFVICYHDTSMWGSLVTVPMLNHRYLSKQSLDQYLNKSWRTLVAGDEQPYWSHDKSTSK